MGDKIKTLLCDIAKENGFSISAMEVDRDHVHLLVEYNPNQSILDVVRLLKQISTYRMWRSNDFKFLLQNNFWRERTFWSDGYFACSVGQVSEEIIKRYISEQG